MTLVTVKENHILEAALYKAMILHTVEPRHTTTLYYDYFFVTRTQAHSFSYLKTPLIRPPRYYDQRPPLGVLSRYFLYKITPLIRPVKMLGGAAE